MRKEILCVFALAALLALLLAGCEGTGPMLPSPDGTATLGQNTIARGPAGELLPDGLGVSNFTVTIDGNPADVREAIPSSASGVSVCFILDATGSMGGTIEGVIDSIEAFASAFEGERVFWSGVEYGDATPADGANTWDFFGEERARTRTEPSEALADLQAWVDPITASGGGDTPENPLKALMEAKNTMAWPTGVVRHFIVLTDVGAHERTDGSASPRPDGQPISPYNGSEVLAAFRGWGVIHAVSPDYSAEWPTPTSAAANRPGSRFTNSAGWDVRELADGGPPDKRTHTGTGGKWTEMPGGGNVDLTTLGIAEVIQQSYTVVYTRPGDLASGHVVITATYTDGSGTHTVQYDLGTVVFE